MDISEEVKALELITETDKKDSVIMTLFDNFDHKEDLTNIYKFCKMSLKEFKQLMNERDVRRYIVSDVIINLNLSARTIIQNFDPDSTSNKEHPMEIKTTFSCNSNRDTVTVRGSAYYGGCNLSEYEEFFSIIKNGVRDIKGEF